MPAVLIILLCFLPPAFAQGPIALDAATLDPDRSEFALIVAGASDEQVFMTAGHLMLRSSQDGQHYTFDWGVFDPTKKDFFLDYMRGHLNYEHIVRPFHETIRIYQSERRQLTLYPLRLTRTQKQRLIFGLIAWARPENRVYAYDIVFRNCSTVIGNLVADAVSPKLSHRLKQQAAQTIRQSGLPYLAHFPPIEVFADIVGGRVADAPIQVAELFYLPIVVPQILAPMPAYDDEHRERSERLLGTPEVLLHGANVPPSTVSWTTIVGLAIFGSGAVLMQLARRSMLARNLWFIFTAGSIGVSGILGGVIVFLRFFSQHRFAHENLHLFFFWPIDIVAFVMIKYCRPHFLRGYAALHLAVAALTTLYALTWTGQNLQAGWTLSVPIWLLLLIDATRTKSNLSGGEIPQRSITRDVAL